MTGEWDNQNGLAGDEAGQAGRGRGKKALHVMLVCIFPDALSSSKQSATTTESYLSLRVSQKYSQNTTLLEHITKRDFLFFFFKYS